MPDTGTSNVSRRTLLPLPLFLATNAFAQQKPSPENLAKVGCWIVGTKLGLASLIYFRKTGAWEAGYNEARSTAQEIGIEVRPFPPQPENGTDGIIKMLDYVGKGDGVRIADDIRRKHGAYHAALFEVGERMFHMPLIYDLDPALADKISAFIRSKVVLIGLPERLWKPSIDAVAKRSGFAAVRTAVVEMNDDVRKYLIDVARGQA